MTEVLRRLDDLSVVRSSYRRIGQSLGLVPTMGALHAGHRSLIDASRSRDERVGLWIFVNPLQFNDKRDLEAYPRDLDADVAIAEEAGVDFVFVPSVEELYPSGEPLVRIDPGPFGKGPEGSRRPGHFVGVATVVAKMLAMVAPDRAYFGEKDYEQLLLVRRLALDLSFPVEIVSCPTIREEDGLAMSSRNRRLSEKERSAAAVLSCALASGREVLLSGASTREAERAMAAMIEGEPLVTLEYALVLDASTLRQPGRGRPTRLLAAATVGPVRLIDNIPGPRPGLLEVIA